MTQIALLIICLLCAGLKKAYRQAAVSPREESRRMSKELRTVLDHTIFLNAFFDTLALFALALFAASAAVSNQTAIAVLEIFAALVAVMVLLPGTRADPLSRKLAGWLSGPLAYFLDLAKKPVARLEASMARANRHLHKAEPLSRDALTNLLEEQRDTSGDEIKADLDLALAALRLRAQKIGDFMVRKQKARMVGIDEQVGPVLLSELHKSNRKVFPAARKGGDIAGVIRLEVLAELKAGGRAGKALNPQMSVVNKNDSALAAVEKFIRYSAELLFVEDDAGEVAGIVYLEDILGHILPQQ